MGRRASWRDRQREEERAKRGRLHPAWRGVGCLLIVILGAVAYYLSGKLIESGLVYFPNEARMALTPYLPQYAVIKGVVSLLFMMLSFAVLSTIYAIAFPVKPGEFDVPPPRKRDRKKRF